MTAFAGLLNRLDDRVNPIVLKELRQAVNGRFVAAVLGMFLLISLITVTVALMQINPSNPSEEMGLGTLQWLQGILVTTCLLFLPGYTAARMAAERSDTNTDLLFISTLRPRQIISGKLLASAILGLLIYSACMPFMTLTYLLRGVDLPSIFLILAMSFTVVLVAIALALFAACASTSRGFRVMLGLSLLSTLGFAISIAVGTSFAITESGFASTLFDPAFWGIVATWLLGAAGSIALLFSFSVALISPPTSNRALGVRLTVLTVWLADDLALWLWIMNSSPSSDWMWLFCVGGALVACAMILVAVCERDQWTDRLLRSLPRSAPMRLGAMLFCSGALGGLLFAWMIVILTWLGLLVLGSVFFSSFDNFDRLLQLLFALPAYTFAYALTARPLRQLLLSRWVKQEQTWALAAVIAALCVGVPILFQLMTLGPDSLTESNATWMILSPISLGGNESTRTSGLVLAVTWSLIAVVINIPWFGRQLHNFMHQQAEPVP